MNWQVDDNMTSKLILRHIPNRYFYKCAVFFFGLMYINYKYRPGEGFLLFSGNGIGSLGRLLNFLVVIVFGSIESKNDIPYCFHL